jgi:hypothetical protein
VSECDACEKYASGARADAVPREGGETAETPSMERAEETERSSTARHTSHPTDRIETQRGAAAEEKRSQPTLRLTGSLVLIIDRDRRSCNTTRTTNTDTESSVAGTQGRLSRGGGLQQDRPSTYHQGGPQHKYHKQTEVHEKARFTPQDPPKREPQRTYLKSGVLLSVMVLLCTVCLPTHTTHSKRERQHVQE